MNTKKITVLVFLMFVFGWTLSACGGEDPPTPAPPTPLSLNAVIAEGHIFPSQDATLSFSVRGTVSKILVEEGEQVTEGQNLIHLDGWEQAEANLRAAELELTRVQQAYDDFIRTGKLATADAWQAYLNAQTFRAEAARAWDALDLEDLEDKIDDAAAEVNDREADLEDAQEEFDKYKDLDEDNNKRKDAEDDLKKAQEDFNEAVRDWEEAVQTVDGVRAALDVALAEEEEAKRDFEARAEDGLDPNEKALFKAQLTSTQAQVAAAKDTRDEYTLKAPFTGTITTINVKVGQLAGPEVWAAQIADLSTFYVETSDLTELEVVKIHEGQTVKIVPDALPELALAGVVENIAQSFQTQAGDIVYAVKIHLKESDPALRWGMTVEATFAEK